MGGEVRQDIVGYLKDSGFTLSWEPLEGLGEKEGCDLT